MQCAPRPVTPAVGNPSNLDVKTRPQGTAYHDLCRAEQAIPELIALLHDPQNVTVIHIRAFFLSNGLMMFRIKSLSFQTDDFKSMAFQGIQQQLAEHFPAHQHILAGYHLTAKL